MQLIHNTISILNLQSCYQLLHVVFQVCERYLDPVWTAAFLPLQVELN